MCPIIFLQRANPDPFLFIFVLFKDNFTEKTADASWIQTRIVGVDG